MGSVLECGQYSKLFGPSLIAIGTNKIKNWRLLDFRSKDHM